MTKLAEIEAAALRLPKKQRLQLAGKLLHSVPPPFAERSPEETLAEVRRRDAEISSGKVKTLTLAQFRAAVRRKSSVA